MLALIKRLLIPPGSPLLLAVVGLSVWSVSPAGLGIVAVTPKLGVALVALAVTVLWIASMPMIAEALSRRFAPPPPIPGEDDADAIVVLGCGYRHRSAGYIKPHLSGQALERLHIAARLHKRTGKPVLLAGGDPYQRGSTEAAVMARVMATELGVYPRWLEDHSTTTWENAAYSRPILEPESIRRVFIVAHQLDMPRALAIFTRFGFEPVAAPAGMDAFQSGLTRFIPSTEALGITWYVLYEMIGMLFYRLRPVPRSSTQLAVTDDG